MLDASIERHVEGALRLLEALVACKSVVGTEQEALEIFAAEAAAIGFEVERLPFDGRVDDDPQAGVPQKLTTGLDRFQVVARSTGDGPLRLLLNGHIDVVPASRPDLWKSRPFTPERRNGRIYGRGSADMKCGFAVGMLALRAVLDTVPGIFDKRRIGFVAVIEEECTGNGTLQTIRDHRIIAPEVVVLESTDLDVMTGGVGVLWLDVTVIGSSGHARGAATGANAIDAAMRLVAGLRDWASQRGRSEPEAGLDIDNPYAVNVGRLTSGDWVSTRPAVAELGVRIGFPRSWSPQRAEAQVAEAITRIASDDPAFAAAPVVRSSGLRAQGYLQDADTALVRDLRRAHRDAHGTDPRVFMVGSTTDARHYINVAGSDAVCFGATGHDLHGIDESVESASIIDAARTLARFILMRFGDGEAT